MSRDLMVTPLIFNALEDAGLFRKRSAGTDSVIPSTAISPSMNAGAAAHGLPTGRRRGRPRPLDAAIPHSGLLP